MIIFGTRTMNSTIGTGVFNCPTCSCQQHYNMIGVNRWFTLYFIPVIPMGRAGQYVQCSSCAGTFAEEMLTYDPAVERAASAEAFRRILVMSMVFGNRIEPENVLSLREVYESLSETTFTAEQAQQEINLARSAGVEPGAYIRQQGESLSAEAKGSILRLVAQIYAPGRELHVNDRAALEQLAIALNFPSTQLDAVLSRQ